MGSAIDLQVSDRNTSDVLFIYIDCRSIKIGLRCSENGKMAECGLKLKTDFMLLIRI